MTLAFAKKLLLAFATEADISAERSRSMGPDINAQMHAANCSQISIAIRLVLLELEYAEDGLRQARPFSPSTKE